jgi:polysaccharide biosynthesis protein PslG
VCHYESPDRSSIGSRLRRLTARLALAATFLAGTLATLGTSSAEAAAPANMPAVGAQFHGMWTDYTDAQRAEVLDQLAAAGVGWVRLDVSWAMLQPDGPDSYSTWGVNFVDRVVDMAHERGLKVLVLFWLTPGWANGGAGERVLPTRVSDYANAARWAAAHFAGRVQAWEVWNEPNQDTFMRGTDPVAYTKLLRAAYPAFHAGDPSTTVVFGGPAYNDTGWIGKCYAAGAHGYFDAMATHPYMGVADQAPETPDDGTMWTLTHVAAVHSLMAKNGDGDKPVWFTEFGWSSHDNGGIDFTSGADNWLHGVSKETQADYLVRAIKLVRDQYPYVTHMFWYSERDVDTSNIQNANYGLMTHDLTPKPVYYKLQSFLTSASTTGDSAGPSAQGTATATATATARRTVSGRVSIGAVRIGHALHITAAREPRARHEGAQQVRRSHGRLRVPLPASSRAPTRRT